MKRLGCAVVLGAALLMGGCADYYGPGPGPGPGPYGYDAFYDGYYGPFYDGYWGSGGVFYYSRGPRHRYVPDRGGHFFHDHPGRAGDWHAVHGPGNFRGGPGFHGGPGRGRGGRPR